MQVEEHEQTVRGILYVLPYCARFELHPENEGATLKGDVDRNCLVRITGGGRAVLPGIIGMTKTVKLRIREVFYRGRTVRYAYTLLAIDDVDAADT